MRRIGRCWVVAIGWIVLGTVLGVRDAQAAPAATQPVELKWLDGSAPGTQVGVSWGVPWPRGAVAKDAAFQLTAADGRALAVQSWPLAYWPDGSLKWSGHAAVTNSEGLKLSVGPTGTADAPITVSQTDDAIEVRNGKTTYRLGRKGRSLVQSVAIDGREVAKDGTLVCMLEDRSNYDNNRTTREVDFASEITGATVEQGGPVRAVVKIVGKHKSDGGRAWLPFSARLYFYEGVAPVRMVDSIVFDGDADKDFIRGLGVRFGVPMRSEAHNRHVRLAGETGMFAEPVRVIAGRRNPSPELYEKQTRGEPIPKLDELSGKENVAEMAVWDAFKLTQLTADGYTIEKRTNGQSAWIRAIGGTRAMGLAFVGDESAGLALGQRNFWQLHPSAVEVSGASSDAATVTAWMWSPDAPAMDVRHYDTKGHGLEASYEDYEKEYATPYGVARTFELTLCAFGGVPTNAALTDLARSNATPARLVCSPERYHAAGVFGVWSLPDRSHATKRWIEEQLDAGVKFYQDQIEQRRWYGFWDYGDVMHSYDAARHTWRYDIGGFAWANTELMPDLWLWYSFLRSGRADVFRMAEAMTRHTQEVDVHHIGPYAGLGSRHNVRHWGDSAKEMRVSQAFLKRFLYYLTTDERMGDLMDEVVDADQRLVDVDPLRKIEPKSQQYPTHIRVGPDWLAAAGNWMTAWERTGDVKYRDRILAGARSIAELPRGFFSGDAYGYDPKTRTLHVLHPDDVAVPHLAALMGGPEVAMELTPLVNSPEWKRVWLNYCQYLQAPAEEQRQAIGGTVNNGRGNNYSRMTAYAAAELKDAKLAARAWQQFFGGRGGRAEQFAATRLSGPDVPHPMDENRNVSTNGTAQWSLNAIELLELVGDAIPETRP